MADPVVTVRPGTLDDVPAFRALGEAVVPPTYGPIDAAYARRMLDEWWVPEVFETSLARNPHLVAEVDGEVVALANLGRLSQSYRDFPHVSGDREVMWKLYVHPDHHGRGIGSRLLADVEAMVEGDELWLEVVDGNDQAFDFYRARGFEAVERVTDHEWPADVWMRKQLGTRPR
jgi:ribosomal protein S18 acetylase RimI-like enzyme